MSSICLTCKSTQKLDPNKECVFTAQGDLQCTYDVPGLAQDKEIKAAERVTSTAYIGTPSSQVYPVRGVNDKGYYQYISDLSGQPILNRYDNPGSASTPSYRNYSCGERLNYDTSEVKGVPEWGAHRAWLAPKDGTTLKDPVFSSP